MRLIDADALYKLFMVNPKGERIPEVDCDNFPVRVDIHDIKKAILKSPTIDAVPVVHGEWIPAKDPYDRVYCYRHAGCGCEHNEQSAFCPNCGAKMDGEK